MKLDCITVTKILRCFRTSGCRKSRNRHKNKKFVVLAEYFEQQTNCSRYRRKMSQSRRSPSSRNQSYLPFFIKQMETMSRSHKNGRHLKSTFDFSEFVNNYGLKRGTVWKILRFISQFSLKLYIQFWKYFHSMILGRLGRGYCKKNRVLEFLAKIFG